MADLKFNLGKLQIFQLIILIGLILPFNFLGLNYILDGNLLISGVIVLLMGIFYILSLKFTKDHKYEIHKQKFLHFYSTLFIVLFVLFIVSWGLMAHFYNVNTNCKKEITAEVNTKLDLISQAALEYKTRSNADLQDYTINLRNSLNSYVNSPTPVLKNQLSSPPYNINTNILDNPSTINPIDLANSRAQALQLQISAFQKKSLDSSFKEKIEKKRKGFQNWNWFSIASSYKNINATIDASIKTINTHIQKLPIRNSPITYQLAKNDLELDKPFVLAKQYHLNILWPMVIMLFLHLLLLLDYYYTIVGKIELTEGGTNELTYEW
jgi:hypothetical protein